jgi:hypothetical protein
MKVEVFPGPGTKVCLGGQAYEFLRIGFYQDVKGEVREVAYWKSICAEPGCSEPIEVFQRLGCIELTRRCPEHRKPGVRVRRHFLRAPRAPEPETP